jgi:hypothetical protein
VPFPESDELGTTPTNGGMRTNSVAPPTYNPPSSSLIKEPGNMAVPGGFQFDVGMPPAEAHLQDYQPAPSQTGDFPWWP